MAELAMDNFDARLSDLPPHVIDNITQRLTLQCRKTLRLCVRVFGGHPTDELLRGIRVPLEELDLDAGQVQESHFSSMLGLTHLTLVPGTLGLTIPHMASFAPFADQQQHSNDDLPNSLADPALCTTTTTHYSILECHQRRQCVQAAALLSRFAHAMPLLTTLTLNGLPLVCVVAAARGLASARPTLSTVVLRRVDMSLHNTVIDPQHTAIDLPCEDPFRREANSAWDGVWAALAGVSSLRALAVDDACWAPGDLTGLSQLSLLQSLTIGGRLGGSGVHPVNFLDLSRLTQLQMSTTGSSSAWLTPCGLSHLRQLQSLDLDVRALRHWLQHDALNDTPALLQLTRLALRGDNAHARVAQVLAQPHWAASRLTVLHVDASVPLCPATLAALAGLTSLSCTDLAVPLSTSDACLPHVRLLAFQTMKLAARAGSGVGGGSVGNSSDSISCPIPLAHLCPALESLTLVARKGLPMPVEPPNWLAEVLPPHLQLPTLGRFEFHVAAHALTSLTPLLAGSCPALHTLHILGCPPSQPSKLQLPLAFGSGPVRRLGCQLRSFHFWASHDAELQQLVAVCPGVTEVSLSRSPHRSAVTDVGVAALAALVCLRDVSIADCALVTPAGILAVAASRSVQRIKVVACPLVLGTDAQRVVTLLGRPWLDIEVLRD